MSRGLGRVEREILALLALYEKLGTGWRTFEVGGSFYRKLMMRDAGQYSSIDWTVRNYEAGEIVEVSRLRRELSLDKSALSRALRSLTRKDMVYLRPADPSDDFTAGTAKFASLTDEGRQAAARSWTHNV
jgi:DNA-binding MarR family transcriptional regulator